MLSSDFGLVVFVCCVKKTGCVSFVKKVIVKLPTKYVCLEDQIALFVISECFSS